MKVLYLIQTFKAPEQIYRLVKTIKKSSPEALVLVSHDFTACELDIMPLKSLPGVEVIKLNGKGGRGDFSMIQGYLDAVDLLLRQNIDFDWLYNITGQDYPTQPLPQIEKFLAETKYDGFLEYFNALSKSEHNTWNIKEGRNRYLYQYWRSGIRVSGNSLPERILRRLGLVFNNVQPFIRLSWSFDGLMVGVLATSNPFNENFLCYGGSFFHILSRKCVQFLCEFSRNNSELVNYYKQTCVSVESFVQTILVNSGLFNLCNDSKRYFDFSNSQHGSPRILTVKDYPSLIKDDFHFARKFDLVKDSKILDMLDARIINGS